MGVIKTRFNEIGEDHKTYIIAEIGSNHNGNFDIACELIEKASEAGASAVKFQTFKAKNHYSKNTKKISLYETPVYELIQGLEINRTWHKKLSKVCDKLQIDMIDSPCDFDAVDICMRLDMPLMKIASFDMVDVRLIDYISKTKKGVIFSTGMASMAEIETAVNICRKNGNNNIIGLQCTSLYPAPYHLSNLNAIKTIKNAFNIIVGYSDHTLGDHVAIASVAKGAKVIEKHYSLSRDMQGPDHKFSIEPVELKSFINKVRQVEDSMGDGIKSGPREEEMEMYNKARRSIYAKNNISKGQVIKSNDLVIKRPNEGIHPYLIDVIIGREAKNDIKGDFPVTWSDI